MGASTEYKAQRYALMPDFVYDWDTEARRLESRFLQLTATKGTLDVNGKTDPALNELLEKITPTVMNNRALKAQILDAFSYWELKPEKYGINPWPFALAPIGGAYVYQPESN